MKGARFLILVLVLLALASVPSAAAPLAGPCAPGMAYDPACEVDQNNQINILDIQRTASRFNQGGTWVSDNNHTHLGQEWTGTNVPLKLTGFYGWPDHAPLVLSNSYGEGLWVDSAGGNGVLVYSASYAGVNISQAGGDGIFVGSAGGNGVNISQAGLDGVYVNSAGDDGVDARTNSLTGYGGRFSNGAVNGGGVYAFGGGNDAPDLVLGGSTATNDDDGRIYSQQDLTSSDILLFSMDNTHIHLDEDNNSASGFAIFNGDNVAVWFISESGLAVAGEGSAAVVDAGAEGQQLVYAVHSPQNWLEDFGSSRLLAGEAVVALDSAFARVASLDAPYHIFLTPLGDCALYMAEKAATSFSVRALGGQQCNIAFDYRIVGLRRGYETVRMEQYVEVSDE